MYIMAVSASSVLSSSRGSQTAGVVSVILGGMKILLTSSSKHGSTDEVAAVIAERLQAAHRALYQSEVPPLLFRRVIHIPAEKPAPARKD